ncbi:MAG: hemolysin III family protein [Burkholderiales bacterium]|nr:hemolysin III family protein [Burkholderiales bacterium]
MRLPSHIDREEFANSLSHSIGLLAAMAAAPLLMWAAVPAQRSTAGIIGVCIFTLTMVMLYAASVLCHALPPGRAREVFLKLDHGLIYVFIAGTYTPFALGVAQDAAGWMLFGLIWALAALGFLLKMIGRLSSPVVSTGSYLLIGWLVLVAVHPLIDSLTCAAFQWLVLGGIIYTIGVVFFVVGAKLRYGHLVWHLFVMAGTTCHFLAVLWSATPAQI